MHRVRQIKIPVIRLIRTSLLQQIKEYFAHSTLHGVRFIAQKDRPIWEGLCWFGIVATSFVTTLVIILSLWSRFQTNPTITGPDTSGRLKRTVFPTIGICPTVPFERDRILEWVDQSAINVTSEGNTKSVEDFTGLLAQMSYSRMKEIKAASVRYPAKWLDHVGDLREFLLLAAVKCYHTVHDCKFRNKRLNCCEHFKPILSERGFCFAFNAKFFDTLNDCIDAIHIDGVTSASSQQPSQVRRSSPRIQEERERSRNGEEAG
ncbi:uncharacterized protein LOC131428269 [Malaya genurostris]|uniref:uncharacterized protein LOC131428269 n=1 Tax=Malaya genurostris TaxID=325434 RepID=UPI0026F3BF04|nr:uncharacterized protein LOC131428269 [Malaya genurostris]